MMLTGAWGLIAAFVAGSAVFLLACRATKRLGAGRKVLIGEMMDRHGLDMKSVIDQGLEEELAHRAWECTRCADYETCVERLRSCERPTYRDICPNAKFIDGLRPQS
jgi:hypothetical protein